MAFDYLDLYINAKGKRQGAKGQGECKKTEWIQQNRVDAKGQYECKITGCKITG